MILRSLLMSCLFLFGGLKVAAQKSAVMAASKPCNQAYRKQNEHCNCNQLFGLVNICNSTHEIEVRLSYIDSNQLLRVYVLTYDSVQQWQGQLFQDVVVQENLIRTEESPHVLYQLKPTFSFDSILAVLKKNKLFKLNSEGSFFLTDLPTYQIIYKKGKKVRKIYFPSPDNWVALDPGNRRAWRHYNIVHLFQDQFKFEK